MRDTRQRPYGAPSALPIQNCHLQRPPASLLVLVGVGVRPYLPQNNAAVSARRCHVFVVRAECHRSDSTRMSLKHFVVDLVAAVRQKRHS